MSEHERNAPMSKSEVEAAFRVDLNALLAKWGAQIQAEDHYPGYPECGEDIRIEVTIPSIWNKQTGEDIREWTVVDLGSYVPCPKTHDCHV